MNRIVLVMVAAVLAGAIPSLLEGQVRSPWTMTVETGLLGSSSTVLHEDRFRTSYSRGWLVGLGWERGVAGRVGMHAGGALALGSTLVMEETEWPCAPADPSTRPSWCRSKGSPQLGVLRVTAGPSLRMGVLEVLGGAGFTLDLGGVPGGACPSLYSACIALGDFGWPGPGGVLVGGAGGRWDFRGRDVAFRVQESFVFRSGQRLRQRMLTVAVMRE